MAARRKRWIRFPRTTAEKRAYYNYNGGAKNNPLVRAKRNPKNLPDAWDDYFIHEDSSWKSKRKTKYNDPNFKRYFIVIEKEWQIWRNIIEHLEKMGYWYDIRHDTLRYRTIIEWQGKDIGDWFE